MPDNIGKVVKDSSQTIGDSLQDGEISEEEKTALRRIGDRLKDLASAIEEKTRYTSILELFNIAKLEIITELDKQKVEDITKFETYMASQRQLYGLDHDDPALEPIQEMTDSYRTNMISYKRKSRNEVKDILKEAGENSQRNIGRVVR